MNFKSVCFLFLIALLSKVDTYSQSSWIKPQFHIQEFGPNTMFTDTIEDWLYIGGHLRKVNGNKVMRVFRINSSGVIDLMDTLSTGSDAIYSITKFKDTVYFLGSDGLHVLKNGNWQSKLGVNYFSFHSSYIFNAKLLIGGDFAGVTIPYDGAVLSYDGVAFKEFERIDTVLDVKNNVVIYSMIEYKGKLYLGGFIVDDKFDHIISWDGSIWENLNGGLKGTSGFESINSMVIYQDELYIAGQFSNEYGAICNSISKWDGSAWHKLGNGLMGEGITSTVVYDMFVYMDNLWVLGQFDSTDYMAMNNIAIWNGEFWCKPPGHFDGLLNCHSVFNDTLYIGGNFRAADGDSAKQFVVKYDESIPMICQDTMALPNSIADYKQAEGIYKLYPNPNNGQFTIKLALIGNVNLYIYSALGKLVYQSTSTSKSQITIDLKGMVNKGIYFVKVQSNQGIQVNKVLFTVD